MAQDLDAVDLGFDALPGDALHDVLRGYRERGPVATTRFLGLPAWVVTGYDALLEAFLDAQSFPPHRMYEVSLEPAIGRSFISMADPDAHRVFRKLATPAFRSRAVERYERVGMAALAHELIDDFADAPEVDLVASFTARFPYLVITRLLGLPRDQEESFHAWALALLHFRDDPEAARRAAHELTGFLAPVVAARRAEPEDDVISGLVGARAEGQALSDEEVYAHVRLLFPTGGETTHGSLGNLLYALLTQGDAGAVVREDPTRIGDAVDEALRWETPIAVLPRMSGREAVKLAGVEIPPESWVLFAIAGANRDPDVYPDPDRFDLDRARKDSLTFGRGEKSCPGMHLARRSMAVATQVLLERLPKLRLLDRERAVPRRSVLRGPEALLVSTR